MTEAAAQHLLQLVPSEEHKTHGLRIFIDKGGCSGMQYNMKIDKPADGDAITERDTDGGKARIFIDEESLKFLNGSEIDFEDTLSNTGFRINNPNAKQTCGCGTSFEANN